MEKPIQKDDMGVPLFLRNPHIFNMVQPFRGSLALEP